MSSPADLAPLALRARVAEYRSLVSGTLAPLVASRAASLAAAAEELEDAACVAAQLAQLGAAAAEGREARLLADVGGGYRMHASIGGGGGGGGGGGPRVLVHVGAGVYPELTLAEARVRVGARVEELSRAHDAAASALLSVQTDLAVADAAIAALSAGDAAIGGGAEAGGRGGGPGRGR